MHPRLTTAAVAAAFVTVGLTVGSPAPAGADVGGSRGGDNGGGQFSAWAYYGQATGGGSIPTPDPCTLSEHPEVPAHYEYNVVSRDGGATYVVYYDCVADSEVLEDAEGLFPDDFSNWDIIDSWVVTPGDPAEMINFALAQLNPVPPAIVTDPGGDVSGMVNIPTYLSFDGEITVPPESFTDGPLTVTVWADPVGEVEWDTGDDLPACNAPAGPNGECAHNYSRSSVEGEAEHNGLPAYRITATINYQGGYSVSVAGLGVVGGSNDIGGVQRVAETALSVTEAQAINTGG